MQFPCPVCHIQDEHTIHRFRDNMFGSDGEYEYAECRACGLLWQLHVPSDISSYYPAGYYSFSPERPNVLAAILKRARVNFALSGRGVLGRFAVRRWGAPAIADWIKKTGVNESSSILDVGCGGGGILQEFEIAGFRDLHGIDPFIDRDTKRGTLDLRKRDITEEDRTFDLVMFHHSFEHVRDPLATLAAAYRAVKPGGKLLIRTPVGQTYAWRTFGKDWFQLEAPRHLFIHSKRSLELLANECGFDLQDVRFDSSDFMFWTSIQDQQGIPLRSPRSYDVNPQSSIFSEEEIKRYREHAERLNAESDADAAAFYFIRRN